MQDALANEGKANKTANDEAKKATDKRRLDKAARDKKITDALDKLVIERDEAKKQKTVDDKKPGTQAILDALKWVDRTIFWLTSLWAIMGMGATALTAGTKATDRRSSCANSLRRSWSRTRISTA